MKRQLLITAVALAAFAAAAAGLIATSSAAGTTSATRTTTLNYTVRFSPFYLLDLGRKGPSLGDMTVFHDTLVDAKGTVVGHDGLVCTFTNPAVPEASCQGVAKLPGGQLTFQFLNSPPPRKVAAITGGSGRYQDARGQLLIVESPKDQTGSYTFTLITGTHS